MFCKNCGSEISDNAAVCPNCGTQVNATGNVNNVNNVNNNVNNVNRTTGENTIAIIGFVFSFFIALVGLICSIMGYKKAVNEGAPYKGLALAGIIISAISMVLGFIISIFYGSVIAALLG